MMQDKSLGFELGTYECSALMGSHLEEVFTSLNY